MGASMFNRTPYLFEMHTMKRFTDATLVSILQKMRKPGGAKLSNAEWQALQGTEVDKDTLQRDPDAFLRDTAGWFESCYLWSIVSMAAYARSTISARQQQQVLLYCQAVDVSPQVLGKSFDVYDRMLAVPSVAQTSRLPGWVLLHAGMRVRLTTQVLPPWAVQDATGTVMEIDLSPQDRARFSSQTSLACGEMCLKELPRGVYVKLDNCKREFLPPVVCPEHQKAGFCKTCASCRAFQGWILVEPIARHWTFTDPLTGITFRVQWLKKKYPQYLSVW